MGVLKRNVYKTEKRDIKFALFCVCVCVCVCSCTHMFGYWMEVVRGIDGEEIKEN